MTYAAHGSTSARSDSFDSSIVADFESGGGGIVRHAVVEDCPSLVELPPAVVWFTGLSGAGKSTIAREVCARLTVAGTRIEYLDGDMLRDVLPPTGFTMAERDAHVQRVGFFASRLEHHGITVVCALISPYAASRARVRAMCRRFIEVHVATPLHECERRDVKGLYGRARRGQLVNFTGLDDPYEPPGQPGTAG